MQVTETDLMDAIMQASAIPLQEPGEYTISELVEQSGRSKDWIRKELARQGATRRNVRAHNGRITTAWRLPQNRP